MNNINNINSFRNNIREGLRAARVELATAQELVGAPIELVQHKLHILQARRQTLGQAVARVAELEIRACQLGMPIG